MVDAAIVILAGTESRSDTGRLVNGLEAAREFAESDVDNLELIFDGAATQWIEELEDPNHDYHDLYRSVQDEAAVCDYCASAFDADNAIEDAGVVRIDENDGHPSIKSLVSDGYEIITY